MCRVLEIFGYIERILKFPHFLRISSKPVACWFFNKLQQIATQCKILAPVQQQQQATGKFLKCILTIWDLHLSQQQATASFLKCISKISVAPVAICCHLLPYIALCCNLLQFVAICWRINKQLALKKFSKTAETSEFFRCFQRFLKVYT